MKRRLSLLAPVLLLLGSIDCGAEVETPTSAAATTGQGGAAASSSVSGSTATATGAGGAGGAPVDKAAGCVGTFGQALTSAFGRADGTVVAVVKPTDTQCPQYNGDHVVLEIAMNGADYRMVVNVQSTIGDPRVQYLALDHAMPAPAWSEGWHTGLALDYIADFGVHGDAFTPLVMADLSNKIADAITIGQKVSVYSQSSGGASAHQIHRNDGKVDGAIVLDPDGATPKALLFHFGDQTF